MSDFLDQKAFDDFLGEGTVFIVDENKSSCRRLGQVLNDIGVPAQKIHRFNHIDTAEEKLAELRPKMVICDYNVGKFSGLDLFQKVRDSSPESFKSAFIIITSNMSQSAVARAAEEDVDAYILKPFTLAGVKETLLETVLTKIQPSEYILTIQKAKQALEERNFEEALASLKKAFPLNPKPTLAHYYLGQLKNMLEDNQEAMESYNQGLQYNRIHFKCQVGLFDTLMEEKKYQLAYNVIQTLSEYFPPNGERLAAAIRLAVVTKNLKDIGSYYQNFQELDRRTEESVTYVCAGLFVLGKHYLNEHEHEKAVDTFSKLAATSGGNPRYIIPIMHSLIESMIFDPLEIMFERMEKRDIEPHIIELARFFSRIGKERPEHLVKQGMELINNHVEDFFLFKLTIDAMTQATFKKQALNLIEKGKSLWPTKSNSWERLEYFAKRVKERKEKEHRPAA